MIESPVVSPPKIITLSSVEIAEYPFILNFDVISQLWNTIRFNVRLVKRIVFHLRPIVAFEIIKFSLAVSCEEFKMANNKGLSFIRSKFGDVV